MDDRIQRIILHFEQLRPRVEQEVDERELCYDFCVELASRDYDTLRSQHIIDKDLEIESKFEDATEFPFIDFLLHAWP